MPAATLLWNTTRIESIDLWCNKKNVSPNKVVISEQQHIVARHTTGSGRLTNDRKARLPLFDQSTEGSSASMIRRTSG